MYIVLLSSFTSSSSFFAGYPQLLSGTLRKIGDVAVVHQKVYYPEDVSTRPWEQTTQVKRYRLNFPFYPFRTLCPRELVQSKMLPSPFDPSSPLLPAHTQLNITMKRRADRNFLNFMLPENLPVLPGSSVVGLTADQRTTATQFRVPVARDIPALPDTPAADANEADIRTAVRAVFAAAAAAAAAPAFRDYRIKSVAVNLATAYLQVLRIKYKGVSPERPLANVYTSHRSTFTPLTKVSLHQYPLSWESSVRPTAVFISFIK